MSDLWNKLHANSKGHEKYTNSTQFEIVGKHTGHIQPYLLENLSEKTCTIARLVENCPHQRARAYKKKAIKMDTIALPTISEDHTVISGLPSMPRLSEKGKPEPWIKESLQVYEMFITSDLVDASINHASRRSDNVSGHLARLRKELVWSRSKDWVGRRESGCKFQRCEWEAASAA